MFPHALTNVVMTRIRHTIFRTVPNTGFPWTEIKMSVFQLDIFLFMQLWNMLFFTYSLAIWDIHHHGLQLIRVRALWDIWHTHIILIHFLLLNAWFYMWYLSKLLWFPYTQLIGNFHFLISTPIIILSPENLSEMTSHVSPEKQYKWKII